MPRRVADTRTGVVEMIEIPTGRMEAAQVLGDFLTSEEAPARLAHRGYMSGTPMFPASESETIVSVVSRVRQDDGDVAWVAVHHPKRGHALTFIEFAKGKASKEMVDLPTGGDATIGMLAEHLIRARRRVTISVEQEVSAAAFDPVPA